MFKFNFNTNELELFSAEDYIWISQLLFSLKTQKKPMLNYRSDWLLAYYYKTCDRSTLVRSRDGELIAPYEILYDYRKTGNPDWGKYTFTGDFSLTSELAPVREELVGIFRKRGWLYKGDNICPRVQSVAIREGELHIDIQKAHYFDQVATNLSLDYPLSHAHAEMLGVATLREWDLRQSETEKGVLPPYPDSRLANTIGVALAIVAKNRRKEKILLIRRRTRHVAVAQDLFVLPFSFSLNLENKLCVPHAGSIFDLIRSDFRFEQAEELGLEPNMIDFDRVKPLLFCRELVRGGKPQFFFEIELDVPFEDLKPMIRESGSSKNEYKKKVMGLPVEVNPRILKKLSPELNAVILAKQGFS